jgi:hypothetical protein
MTNADKVAKDGGKGVIAFFDESYYGCPPGECGVGRYGLDTPKQPFGKTISCRICWLDWLKQEVTDNG